MVTLISACNEQTFNTHIKMPLFLMRVAAGFPSPAQDFIEKRLDLNDLCIQHPAATYFVRVEGESMIDAAIFPGDILIVDRSLEPKHGDIVIAELSGELTVKELQLKPKRRLIPHNRLFKPIECNEHDMTVFGVVTNVVRSLKGNH